MNDEHIGDSVMTMLRAMGYELTAREEENVRLAVKMEAQMAGLAAVKECWAIVSGIQ